MTTAETIEKLENLVRKRATDGSLTAEKAKALLVKEGIHDEKGNLTPEYGGPTPKAA